MHLLRQDIFTGLTAMVVIACALTCMEWLIKNKRLASFWGRKLLHFIAVGTCAVTIYYFQNRVLLGNIFLLFFFILFIVVKKQWLKINEADSYGMAFFPLAFATLLFMPVFRINYILYAALILAISDAVAGLVGEFYGRQKIIFLFEKKSWAGFTAFYLSALLISLCYYSFSPRYILLSIILALLPAITELFSYKGSDNFTVPVFAAVWIALLNPLVQEGHLQTLLLFILLFISLFIVLSVIAVYKKWLTISGAVAACWVALLLLITGGLKAFIVPGIFLISGSLLSKLNKEQKEKEGRNAIQVFANGIIGVLFMISYSLAHEKIYLITAIISFCISMSDSCSSETGVYCKGRTYDILSLKKMQPGLSGGISLQGTLAGLAGAIIISLVGTYVYHLSFSLFCLITLAGFTGMLTDSILGSWLQVKYNTLNNILAETYEPGAIKAKGLTWCDNNAVNLLSNIIITWLFFYILKQIN